LNGGGGAAAVGTGVHGRRRGRRLRPGRQALLNDLLPRLRITLPESGRRLDPTALFPTPVEDVWLEVGFGAGEHLAAQAAAHPAFGLIGCEVFVDGIAGLLARLEEAGLANVRIFDDDARLLLGALPEACLGRIFLLFPDPWPKKRHHKRRLINTEVLDALARVLKDGAEVWFASDHAGYVRWTQESFLGHDAFCRPARSGPGEPPGGWIATRYEKKARARGAECAYLRFRRRPRARGYCRQSP